MSFLELVRREMHGSLPKLLFMSGLGGISTAAILGAINAGLQGPSLWAATLFIIALFLFIKTQYYVTISTTAEIEAIIHKIRVRLMDQIRRSELLSIEGIGRASIVAAITGDTAVLTQASNMLCFTVQGAVLVFFVAIYVGFLSLAAILTTLVIVSIAAIIFHLKNRRLVAEKQRAAEWERRLYDRLTDFLDGFKEVRLNSQRSSDLFDDAVDVSRTAANIKIKSQAETFQMIVTSQISMYVLLGAVVFVAPQFSSSLGGEALTKTTTALMFIVGACFGLVQSIPVLLNANAAADRIEQLEAALRATVLPATQRDIQIPKRFEKIEMRKIMFRYVDRFSETSFRIGPIDFDLLSGRTCFHHGRQWLRQIDIPAGAFRALSCPIPARSCSTGCASTTIRATTYRALMSAIFFDYHLFQRLYGIPEPEPGEVDRLLTQFRLADKTGLIGRRVSHARSFGRPAQTARAHRQPARKAANSPAGRMDGRTRPRISAQILR